MTESVAMRPESVLDFWFRETPRDRWFAADPEFDALIRDRFAGLHARAGRCELFHWRDQPDGRLAEIIVLDQFSRNLNREGAAAFVNDALALALAQEARRAGADRALNAARRAFLYMPFMHSESLLIHQQAVVLFDQPGLEENLKYELKHKAVIQRFGRYPHRNTALGRPSTTEERAWLAESGRGF